MNFSYNAEIDILTNLSLEVVANQLSIEVDLFDFKYDEQDRFDEIPAYLATVGAIEIVLQGEPENLSGGLFLQLTSKSDINISEYISRYGESLFRLFPNDQPMVAESGYIDVTSQLLIFLRANSTLDFQPAEMDPVNNSV